MDNQYGAEDEQYELDHQCECGSGLTSVWQTDARGITLCKTCKECHEEKMGQYRPDVLTDVNYWSNEPIEPDDY